MIALDEKAAQALIDTHEACKSAVLHTLEALRTDSRKFWLMGEGTETFEKLTAAAALIYDEPQAKVKKFFRPHKGEYERYCAEIEENDRLLRLCRERGIAVEAA